MDMRQETVVAALAAQGYTAELDGHGPGWDPVRFAKEDTPLSRAAVECSFHEDGELACVHVDGRLGPQVTCEGIRLIGRVPSQLAQEMEAHATKHDTGLRWWRRGHGRRRAGRPVPLPQGPVRPLQ
ncbi:hypothetical protein [Streptomyces sp. NPDC093093]|uniref:hypothetical protein n=1 Tax=Streptomyces sp. NPDC093093 TaxID=3366025 RepID=UPI0037F580A8